MTDEPKCRRFEPLSRFAALVVVAGALGMSGCRTFSDHTQATRNALDAHDLEEALRASNRALGVQRVEKTPGTLDKNDALLLLDRAIILQAVQRHALSSRDFQTADNGLELLDLSRSTADEIVRYMFSDSAGPYKARPYEKLMVNTLNMVNYLALQNLEGARVEARRFSIMRSYLLDGDEVDEDAVGRAAAPGSYLAGFIFEKSRVPGEALRYYDEVLQVADISSLGEPIRELSQQSSYRTSRLEAAARRVEGPPSSTDASAEVLIVISYGRVPPLVAQRVPIGLALTIAAAFLPPSAVQQANRLAGQGLVTWINYPELAPSRADYPLPAVQIDGRAHRSELIADVDAVVRKAWDASEGRVIAAAVTRMLTRAAVGAGVGVAAGKASGRGGVGILAAMVAQASMAAADKPDTRSWATLPARMAVVRTKLRPGTHEIQVTVLGQEHRLQATVGPGQWVLVDVADLSIH